MTKLVQIRNSYGRGDFHERWLDDAFNPNGFSNVYVYERSKSAVVALNSRNDAFVEVRNGVQTDFAPGTILVELTGNAADPTVDPSGVIPDTIKVDASGKVNLSIPSNNGQDHGYVIYGVAAPQGAVTLANRGTTQVLAGATPTIANNGTARLANVSVVTSNSFTVQLNTTPVSLADPDHAGQFVRDVHADGDTAMIKIDGGMNINSVAGIDNTTPGRCGLRIRELHDDSHAGLHLERVDERRHAAADCTRSRLIRRSSPKGCITSRCGRFGIAMRRRAATAGRRCSPI